MHGCRSLAAGRGYAPKVPMDDRERVPRAGGEITQDAYAELLAKGEA
jgi:hypothetical protein